MESANWYCHGVVRRLRHVGQLTLAETEHASRASAPSHTHASSSLCLVLEGGFVERVGATRRDGAAGSVLFQPRNEPHSRQFRAGINRCFIVELGPRLSASAEARGLAGPCAAISTERRVSWLAIRLYEEFCRTDAESALAIDGLASAVLAQLIRLVSAGKPDEDSRPPWLPALMDLLEQRYLAPIRLAELSARVGVHPKIMSRAFRRSVGVTLTAYVRRRRIDWACERLIATELPLSRIAMEAGFTDQAHFARLFKQATGLTPRAFRAARTAAR